jgi:predicted ATPase/DNA-binding XRE family transcriptional regulator
VNEIPFGEWLKRQRKAGGLTQEQLADKVGCSAIAIRKFEAEERRPSEQIANRLAQIFEIPEKEQAAFLRFARGNWSSTPEIKTASPWVQTTKRSNLPAALSSFIGREKELTDLAAYLHNPETRLLTLIGPPGIGKTRLSLQAAQQVYAQFEDGTYFVPLAPLTDPRLIPAAVLQALNFVEAKDQPPMQQLMDGIGSRRLLLVLDNCEHLIEDVAPLASGLLSACSRLTILATSRESLRIPGEWLYAVPTLNLPDAAIDIASAAEFSALKLFAERARAVRADFKLTAENLKAVIAICNQLDGLPLAIELIATRIRLMSPKALLKRLNDSFVLSADGMRAVPTRQKTLFNSIGWTYHAMPQDEQKLFQYLSVFSGGFYFSTVEEMFSHFIQRKSVTDLILRLTDKSLLQRNVEPNGDVRFSMLVTIQQFASSQLKASGDETKAKDAHLNWFVEFSAKENAEIRGPGQVESARRVEREQDNIRAALGWSVSSQRTESALRLLSNLGWHWELQAHYREAHDWLTRIRSLADVNQHPLLYARILNHIGRYFWTQETFEEARTMLEESRALMTTLGADGETTLVEANNWLALLLTFQDRDFAQARVLCEQGLNLSERNQYDWGVALSTFHLGLVEDNLRHATEALELFQKSLVMFKELGDLFFISRVSLFMGYLFMDEEKYDEARYWVEEHIRIDTELQFWDGIAEGWRDLGYLYKKMGNAEKSQECLARCREVCTEHGLIKTLL